MQKGYQACKLLPEIGAHLSVPVTPSSFFCSVMSSGLVIVSNSLIYLLSDLIGVLTFGSNHDNIYGSLVEVRFTTDSDVILCL